MSAHSVDVVERNYLPIRKLSNSGDTCACIGSRNGIGEWLADCGEEHRPKYPLCTAFVYLYAANKFGKFRSRAQTMAIENARRRQTSYGKFLPLLTATRSLAQAPIK